MDEHRILKMIDEYCDIKEDKKYLTCAAAYQIAEDLNVNVSIIGQICNQENIKIKNCQIGCF